MQVSSCNLGIHIDRPIREGPGHLVIARQALEFSPGCLFGARALGVGGHLL